MSDTVVAILVAITASVVSSILFFGFQMLVNHIHDKKKKYDNANSAERAGIQALLMDRLEEKGEIYLKRGYASNRDKTIYEKQYTAYHNLGNNGVMTSTYENVMELPTFKQPRRSLKATAKESN